MRALRHVCRKLGRSYKFVLIRPGFEKWLEIASVNGDQGYRTLRFRINVLFHPEFTDSRLSVNYLRMAVGGAIREPRRTRAWKAKAGGCKWALFVRDRRRYESRCRVCPKNASATRFANGPASGIRSNGLQNFLEPLIFLMI